MFNESKGDPDFPVAAGTPFKTLPDDYQCPVCGANKNLFTSKSKVVAGFAENQGYGLGTNGMTGGQKSLLIYGAALVHRIVNHPSCTVHSSCRRSPSPARLRSSHSALFLPLPVSHHAGAGLRRAQARWPSSSRSSSPATCWTRRTRPLELELESLLKRELRRESESKSTPCTLHRKLHRKPMPTGVSVATYEH